MSHEQNIADLTQKIGATHALLRQCKAQEGAITEGAAARLKQVVARLAQIKGAAITDESAADEYLELTQEKGALLRTLAGYELPEEMAKAHVSEYVNSHGTFVAAHEDKKPVAKIKSVDHVRNLLSEHGGKLYVRWSASEKHDMAPGAVSRDYLASAVHAGLSAVPITSDMEDHEIASKLKEYGFLRMKNAKLT